MGVALLRARDRARSEIQLRLDTQPRSILAAQNPLIPAATSRRRASDNNATAVALFGHAAADVQSVRAFCNISPKRYSSSVAPYRFDLVPAAVHYGLAEFR
jgi:hypothetical protein